jgi:hypothetical protein
MEQHTRAGVHIRIWILRLPVFLQHLRCNLGVLLDELEDRIFRDLGTGRGIVHECFEAGIGFTEDGMAVAGDDATGFEGRPKVVGYVFVGEFGANVFLHLKDPAEDFLSGETGVVSELSGFLKVF